MIDIHFIVLFDIVSQLVHVLLYHFYCLTNSLFNTFMVVIGIIEITEKM